MSNRLRTNLKNVLEKITICADQRSNVNIFKFRIDNIN
jgi:hypothetical protein